MGGGALADARATASKGGRLSETASHITSHNEPENNSTVWGMIDMYITDLIGHNGPTLQVESASKEFDEGLEAPVGRTVGDAGPVPVERCLACCNGLSYRPWLVVLLIGICPLVFFGQVEKPYRAFGFENLGQVGFHGSAMFLIGGLAGSVCSGKAKLERGGGPGVWPPIPSCDPCRNCGIIGQGEPQ